MFPGRPFGSIPHIVSAERYLEFKLDAQSRHSALNVVGTSTPPLHASQVVDTHAPNSSTTDPIQVEQVGVIPEEIRQVDIWLEVGKENPDSLLTQLAIRLTPPFIRERSVVVHSVIVCNIYWVI